MVRSCKPLSSSIETGGLFIFVVYNTSATMPWPTSSLSISHRVVAGAFLALLVSVRITLYIDHGWRLTNFLYEILDAFARIPC